MGEWMLRNLNKVDQPWELLIWMEHGRDMMTIRKIREEGMMVISIEKELAKISKLPEKRQEERLAKLPYEIEKRIAERLGIKGSMPYEIRGWTSSVIIDWRRSKNAKERKDKR